MKRILSYLVTTIIFVLAGIGTITHNEKPYMPDTFYVGDQSENGIDYRAAYNRYRGGSFESVAECEKTSKRLPDGYRQFQPTEKSMLWFWAMTEPTAGLLEPFSDTNPNGYITATIDDVQWYSWKVPAGTNLVSIGNSELVPDSRHSEGTYPENQFTKGVHMSLVINDKSKAFRVTYGSMLMWWCCMGKEEPDNYQDGDLSKPRYGHTVPFSKRDTFYSGSVIGVAGQTGIPSHVRKRDTDSAHLLIKIEVSDVDEEGNVFYNWRNSTLEELYEIG